MFCKNCGKEIPEGKEFCQVCEQIATQAETETIEEAPVEETPAAFAEPSFEQQPKKAKKTKWVIGIIAVVVVVLAVLVAFNFSFVQGLIIKTFCSEESYFKYVEKKAFSEYVDYSTDMYGKMAENLNIDNIGSEVKTDIQLGEKALSLIKDNVNTDVDLNWLKNFSFIMNTAIDEKNLDYGVKFNIGEGTLLDFKCLFDMDKQDIYMGIINLSDKYIKIDNGSNATPNASSSISLSPELLEALPTDKEINTLLNKYLGIAIDSLGNVTKTSEEMEAGNYTQKVTVLKYELTEEDIAEMFKKVLKELKNDEKVKEHLSDFESFMLEEYQDLMGSDYKQGDLYENFKDDIQKLLDEIDNEKVSDTEIFTLIDYVNAKHEIIGRKIEINDKSIVDYISIHKGTKFAFEATCESLNLNIFGEGTDKNEKITGEYEFEVDGKTLFAMELENFNAALKNSTLNGSMKLIPSSDLISSLFGTSATENTIISMLEPAIKFSFESNDKTSLINIDILSKDEELVKITMNSAITDDAEVKLPDENSVMTSDKVIDWANSLDLSKIVSALKTAKLPNEIITPVEQYITLIDQYGLGTLIMSSQYDNV